MAALNGQRVRLDPGSASAWYFETLTAAGAQVKRGVDPVVYPRAKKNAAEIQGARNAHARDGAAVTKFLHWMSS